MRASLKFFGAITLSGAILSGVLIAGPAQATGASNIPSTSETPTGKHCWFEVDTERALCAETPDALALRMYNEYGVTLDQRPGENLPEEVIKPSAKVKQLVRAGQAARAASPDATQRAASSSYLLVKAFEDEGYKGYSRTWSVSLQSAPCQVQGNYAYGQYAYMYNYSFNDRMASYQLAPGCRLKVYQDANFRGTMRGPYGNSRSLGILYREVSSMSVVK